MNINSVRWRDNTSFCFALGALLISVVNFALSVWLWNSTGAEPKFDHIAASISTLQIFLAILGFGGFYLIRSAAIKAAEEEARAEFEKLKERLFDEAKAVARRSALEYLETTGMRGGTGNSAQLTPDIMQALDQEEDAHDE